MAESLWLAVCPRRDSMAPLIVSRRVDDDGLQAFAAAIAAFEPDVLEVWLYPLAAEKTVTFAGPMLRQKERRIVGAPHGPVPSYTVGPEGLTSPEFDANGDRVLRQGMKLPDRACLALSQYLAELACWFRPTLSHHAANAAAKKLAAKFDGARFEESLRRVADLASKLDAVEALSKKVLAGDFDRGPAAEPSTDGVAFLASMARQLRPSLSEASCLLASAELYHRVAGYPTAWAAEVLANRAELIDAGSPGIRVGPDGYVTSAAVQEVGHD